MIEFFKQAEIRDLVAASAFTEVSSSLELLERAENLGD